MLGFKRFRSAATTISSIELMHRIRRDQFDLAKLGPRLPLCPPPKMLPSSIDKVSCILKNYQTAYPIAPEPYQFDMLMNDMRAQLARKACAKNQVVVILVLKLYAALFEVAQGVMCFVREDRAQARVGHALSGMRRAPNHQTGVRQRYRPSAVDGRSAQMMDGHVED
jgi:hypothetical protein